jgi:hypothetical protein
MFITALNQRLSTFTNNVYPVVAPLDYERPAIIYNIVNTNPVNDLNTNADLAFIRLRIDVYDTDYITAKTLAKSIRESIEAWRDDDVEGATWEDETDMIDDTTDLRLYRVMLAFSVLATV